MVGWSRWCGVLRKSAALLLIAALAAVSVLYPVLDGDDYTAAAARHFDSPADFGSHGASHNHLVCAVLGSTHGLPGEVRSTHETRDCALAVQAAVIESTPHTRTPYQTRPRAPPVS